MGAAGLTCSSTEMGFKGQTGIDLNLDKVPKRAESMTAYEIMLSESQERMLIVIEKGRESEVQQICDKWERRTRLLEGNQQPAFELIPRRSASGKKTAA